MTKPTIIKFPMYSDNNGILSAYEISTGVPFDIARVFTVSSKHNQVRGHHAHIECSQLLVCVSGAVSVTCNDGASVVNFELQNIYTGLLIPPGVWSHQEYLDDASVVMVLCDKVYDEGDYIRDFNKFEEYLGLKDKNDK